MVDVHGYVAPGFEGVRDAFATNFELEPGPLNQMLGMDVCEVGASASVFHRGEKVVDLWGGVRDKATGDPWQRDTMALIYSATKGLAAMTLAVAHSRGWLDYEERVAAYWPEFAQHGKDRLTVRQLLGHQAGLFAIDEPVDRALLGDLDALAVVLAPALLMVSTIRYRSFKTIDLGIKRSYRGLILLAALIAAVASHPHIVLIGMAYAYLASAFVGQAVSRIRGHKTDPA